MQMKKSLMILVLAALLIIPFASAGFFDFLTGKSQYGYTNVTAQISSNSNGSIVMVYPATAFTPTAGDPLLGGITYQSINFMVYDNDGASDVNLTASYVNVTFSCPGDTAPRNRNAMCVNITPAEVTSGKYVNFTCNLTFYYYDCEADWVINATTQDKYSTPYVARNDTATQHINVLNSLYTTTYTIDFGSLSVGETSKFSLNNNTLNITGNNNPTSIDLNSTNLKGLVFLEYLNANQFKAVTSNSTTYTSPCDGVALNAGQFVTIGNGIGAKPRVRTEQSAAMQWTNVQYCIPTVPSLPRDTYNTAAEGQWTIKGVF